MTGLINMSINITFQQDAFLHIEKLLPVQIRGNCKGPQIYTEIV